MAKRSAAVAAAKTQKEQLKAKCWAILLPALKLRPQGMTLNEIDQTLKNSDEGLKHPAISDPRFVTEFLTEMNREHNILGFVKGSKSSSRMAAANQDTNAGMANEDRVLLRSKGVRTGLKRVSPTERAVYNSIEQSGVLGMNTRDISRQCQMSHSDTNKVFRKLHTQHLIGKFTDPRSRRILWISKLFEDQVLAAVNAQCTPSTFRKSSGAFQTEMVDSLIAIVVPLLREQFGGFIMDSGRRKTFGLSDLKKVIGSLEKTTLSSVQLSQSDVESLLRLMCLHGLIEKHSSFPKSSNAKAKSDDDNSNHLRSDDDPSGMDTAEIAVGSESSSSLNPRKRGLNEMRSSDDPSGVDKKNSDEDDCSKKQPPKEDQYLVITPKLSVFSHIPCQSCKLNDRCQIQTQALINPVQCVYLAHWLDLF